VGSLQALQIGRKASVKCGVGEPNPVRMLQLMASFRIRRFGARVAPSFRSPTVNYHCIALHFQIVYNTVELSSRYLYHLKKEYRVLTFYCDQVAHAQRRNAHPERQDSPRFVASLEPSRPIQRCSEPSSRLPPANLLQ